MSPRAQRGLHRSVQMFVPTQAHLIPEFSIVGDDEIIEAWALTGKPLPDYQRSAAPVRRFLRKVP